jgi:hypothetical protein
MKLLGDAITTCSLRSAAGGLAAAKPISGGTDVLTMYADYAIDLGIDLLAIFLLAYVLYFRRHRRADLLLAYVTLNIGIFVAVSLLSMVRLDIALGFGLFAILSIIRLRSSTVTQQEVAYYFVALVTGLVNGLSLDDRLLVGVVNALLIGTMLVVDSKPLRARAQRMDVTLDVVHHNEDALVADLERRLRGRVMHYQVNEIDYVRDVMVVDVRFQATPPVKERTVSRIGPNMGGQVMDDSRTVYMARPQ